MSLVDVYSRGSKNHHKDQCMPCRHNLSGTACPRGSLCNCCHYHHGPEKLLALKLFALLKRPEKHIQVASPMPAPQRVELCTLAAPPALGSPTGNAALAGGGAGEEVHARAQSPAEEVAQVVTSLGHLAPEQLAAMLQEAAPEHYHD